MYGGLPPGKYLDLDTRMTLNNRYVCITKQKKILWKCKILRFVVIKLTARKNN